MIGFLLYFCRASNARIFDIKVHVPRMLVNCSITSSMQIGVCTSNNPEHIASHILTGTLDPFGCHSWCIDIYRTRTMIREQQNEKLHPLIIPLTLFDFLEPQIITIERTSMLVTIYRNNTFLCAAALTDAELYENYNWYVYVAMDRLRNGDILTLRDTNTVSIIPITFPTFHIYAKFLEPYINSSRTALMSCNHETIPRTNNNISIDIFIAMPTGQQHRFSVLPTRAILDLRYIIRNYILISLNRFHLVFRDAELPDADTLSALNIRAFDLIDLVITVNASSNTWFSFGYDDSAHDNQNTFYVHENITQWPCLLRSLAASINIPFTSFTQILNTLTKQAGPFVVVSNVR